MYHPNIDGQNKEINAVVEQYLRCVVNYLQDDWDGLLSLDKMAGNKTASETMNMSPFFVNYDFDPHFSAYLVSFQPYEDQPRNVVYKKQKNIHNAIRNQSVRKQHKQWEEPN